ncbi:uracil-DNA glycosylase [Sediminibacillus massiliensis]|uniref:uracil-DNA glycosylase n=1 Tax=Sediminibacillus massiliensis TaxID=1926277 RepID=UPI00098846F1|nr:uracil-DNA glycosylase [Sediminibacillus massiliensis]
MVKQILNNDWQDILQSEFQEEYYLNLREFLKQEYNNQTVFPAMENIYEALNLTPYSETKVVILGQDPYHGPDQAHGLSFSVQPGVNPPPSLKNIFKELQDDLGCPIPEHGYLKKWADQGVLLLNTALTVRKGKAASHRGQGWENFTNRVIRELNKRDTPVVFLLWGRHAQEKQELLDTEKHRIITSPHPSPFSARKGFFGSKPFSRANGYLEELGQDPIDWCLPVK